VALEFQDDRGLIAVQVRTVTYLEWTFLLDPLSQGFVGSFRVS
jgi:hypothetical protein